jgi:phosphoribosylformylglycinamidine synthase
MRAEPGAAANPNGSLRAIAGVMNAAGNVAGLMPHPETAVEAILGSDDGLGIIRSFVESAAARASAAEPVALGGAAPAAAVAR